MLLKEKLNWIYGVKTNWFQTVLRVLLGLALILAGISHLTFARTEFIAQVPKWLPVAGDLIVILSGIVELALGMSLVLIPQWKAIFGCLAAIFFILIFPGNIAQYINHTDALGMYSDNDRLKRLFFQPVLILWALYSTGVIRAYLRRNRGQN